LARRESIRTRVRIIELIDILVLKLTDLQIADNSKLA
jgi:hypothetical protein